MCLIDTVYRKLRATTGKINQRPYLNCAIPLGQLGYLPLPLPPLDTRAGRLGASPALVAVCPIA